MNRFELLVLPEKRRGFGRFKKAIGLKFLGSRQMHVDIPQLGLRYVVLNSSLIGRLLLRNGMYEEHIINWVTTHFQPDSGGVFVDVGANFGWYSCLFARIAGDRGRVFLFEPESGNADLLAKNLELNDARNCKLFRAAVGNEPGTAFLQMAHRRNPGAHSLIKGGYSEGEVEVPVVTLDDALLPHLESSAVSLLKMDIEGFELQALRGATRVLERTNAIILEFSPDFLKRGGFDPAELWRIIRDQGFSTNRFDYDRGPVPITRQPLETCDLLLLRSTSRQSQN